MKVGNLDCTMCLDCVHACPHDNIALVTRTPGAELLERGRRSGIGRLPQRADLAALAVVFTFAALVSAFAMTGPAYAIEQRRRGDGRSAELKVLAIIFLVGLLLAPTLLLWAAGTITRLFAEDRETVGAAVAPTRRADPDRRGHLGRTLRLPPADRSTDDHSSRAERDDRRVRSRAAWRSILGLGRAAARSGVSDSARMCCAWRSRIDGPGTGDLTTGSAVAANARIGAVARSRPVTDNRSVVDSVPAHGNAGRELLRMMRTTRALAVAIAVIVAQRTALAHSDHRFRS